MCPPKELWLFPPNTTLSQAPFPPRALNPPLLSVLPACRRTYWLAGARSLVRGNRPSSTGVCEAHTSSLSPGEARIHTFSFTQMSVFAKLVGTWYPWYPCLSLSAWHHTLVLCYMVSTRRPIFKAKNSITVVPDSSRGSHVRSQWFRKNQCW